MRWERVSGQFKLGDNGNLIKKLKIAIAVIGVVLFVLTGLFVKEQMEAKKRQEFWRKNRAVADSLIVEKMRTLVDEAIRPIRRRLDSLSADISTQYEPLKFDTVKIYEQYEEPKK